MKEIKEFEDRENSTRNDVNKLNNLIKEIERKHEEEIKRI